MEFRDINLPKKLCEWRINQLSDSGELDPLVREMFTPSNLSFEEIESKLLGREEESGIISSRPEGIKGFDIYHDSSDDEEGGQEYLTNLSILIDASDRDFLAEIKEIKEKINRIKGSKDLSKHKEKIHELENECSEIRSCYEEFTANIKVLHWVIYHDGKKYYTVSGDGKITGKYTTEELYLELCSISESFRKHTIGKIEHNAEEMNCFMLSILDEVMEKRRNSSNVRIAHPFSDLYLQKKMADVYLNIDDGCELIPAHRMILGRSCEYFYKTLYNMFNWKNCGSEEFQNAVIKITELRHLRKEFLEVLRFIYIGYVTNISSFEKLSKCADFLGCTSLISIISTE